jgi:preprotein translocase subunit YajC
MNFLIETAHAQAAPPPGGGMLEFMIMIGIFFAIMYFLVIRPQSKRAKEHKQLLESLTRGDEVVTSGGVLGRVTDVGDTFIELEIASGVQVKVQKIAVTNVMPKGTMRADTAKPEKNKGGKT